MQCVTDLAKLRSSIIKRIRHIREAIAPVTSPLGCEDRRALSFATIELDNLVIVGLRQYAKSSLLGSRTAAGDRITASVRPQSTEEAAALIFKSINPKGYQNKNSPVSIPERDEISIRNPKQIEKVFLDYSISNISNLTLALSLNALAFSEVKVLRHFFAHRAKNTYEEVMSLAGSLGISNLNMPEEFLVQGRPGVGVRFVDSWLADVEDFFDLAT